MKINTENKSMRRILCHFSCGAASAVATKLAINKYGKKETMSRKSFEQIIKGDKS